MNFTIFLRLKPLVKASISHVPGWVWVSRVGGWPVSLRLLPPWSRPPAQDTPPCQGWFLEIYRTRSCKWRGGGLAGMCQSGRWVAYTKVCGFTIDSCIKPLPLKNTGIYSKATHLLEATTIYPKFTLEYLPRHTHQGTSRWWARGRGVRLGQPA